MSSNSQPHFPELFIAIPAMNEYDYLPATIRAISNQVCRYKVHLYICVNQPENYWAEEEKIDICHNNQKTLEWLKSLELPNLHLIDHSTQGMGWDNKNYGVGYARKVLFDAILSTAHPNDILISMDADTVFNENYFQSIGDTFHKQRNWEAISVPYYHKLTEDDNVNRAILRYELYLRNYALNMFLIGSPYAFTAIGSAIAIRISALKKIGGITPVKSGEDFYLLQKLRKMGIVGNWNPEQVNPASRFSSRVFFGTGPAMIKGNAGDWSSYPIYHHQLYQEIEECYQLIETVYTEDIEKPFFTFLHQQFKEENLWIPLRKNFNTLAQFTKGFHQKVDGLRILQYLKQEQDKRHYTDFDSLKENWKYLNLPYYEPLFKAESLKALSTDDLQQLRNILWEEENQYRKNDALAH